MVRILHAADFHLDSPYRALSVEKARQRRREGRENLYRFANFANAEGADIILLSGDLFDSTEIYRETTEALAEALGAIHGRVFIAPGNHDFWDENGPYGEVDWPGNVHIFKSTAVEAVELPELGCTVYGAAFTQSECTESLLKDFCAPEDGNIHVMTLHADVEGGARYDPITRQEIAASGLDYLALGHVHSFSGIRQDGTTAWAYPGCPEGRGFDECGPHGVIAGTVDHGRTELRFVEFARRRYEIVKVDLTGREVSDALEDTFGAEGTSMDICRVILTGDCTDAVAAVKTTREALGARFYQLEVRDETRVAGDLWDRAGEDSLRGLFLRKLLEEKEKAETPEALTRIERAARFGLAALDRRDL